MVAEIEPDKNKTFLIPIFSSKLITHYESQSTQREFPEK